MRGLVFSEHIVSFSNTIQHKSPGLMPTPPWFRFKRRNKHWLSDSMESSALALTLFCKILVKMGPSHGQLPPEKPCVKISSDCRDLPWRPITQVCPSVALTTNIHQHVMETTLQQNTAKIYLSRQCSMLYCRNYVNWLFTWLREDNCHLSKSSIFEWIYFSTPWFTLFMSNHRCHIVHLAPEFVQLPCALHGKYLCFLHPDVFSTGCM